VLVGPTGGVVCLRSNGRRQSIGVRPLAENEEQEIPAVAPVEPTHTKLFLDDAATVFGNSPGMATGSATAVSCVAFVTERAIILSVFDPALTANRYYNTTDITKN
jgi:hypothetical protein